MSVTTAWDKVRHIPASDLRDGDTWIVPAAFTTYWAAPDGRVRGNGWQPLTGTAWTLLGRNGDQVEARSDDGREVTDRVPATAKVLRLGRAPVQSSLFDALGDQTGGTQ